MKNLIEKYFDGKTSLEEEAQLRAYFNGKNVDEHLRQYQPLFCFFENEKERCVSEDFEERFFKKTDRQAKIVSMKNWRRKLIQIAAAAAVLFGAFVLLQPPPPATHANIDWSAYEITDEQIAVQQTIDALKLLSAKLNKGKNQTVDNITKAKPATKYLN